MDEKTMDDLKKDLENLIAQRRVLDGAIGYIQKKLSVPPIVPPKKEG
jgi:hypothetical protein